MRSIALNKDLLKCNTLETQSKMKGENKSEINADLMEALFEYKGYQIDWNVWNGFCPFDTKTLILTIYSTMACSQQIHNLSFSLQIVVVTEANHNKFTSLPNL